MQRPRYRKLGRGMLLQKQQGQGEHRRMSFSQLQAFIYVARQLLKGKTPSLSFCQAFSLGNAKEKAEGSRATGSNAAVHSGVRRLISKFTGCPHLFADLARRGVDTRRERCLHTNEYFNLEGRIHEPRSQTAPSGNT